MNTRIYISHKIQKNYKKLLLNPLPEKTDMEQHQNSWNANYTAIYGKKCWLLTHSQTRYSIILPDIKVKDVALLQSAIQKALFDQLFRKHPVEIQIFLNFIGTVQFYPTNNDRSTIAYNNRRMEELNYWKFRYDNFDAIPFSRIGAKSLNEIGRMVRNGKSVFIYPTTEFLELLNR